MITRTDATVQTRAASVSNNPDWNPDWRQQLRDAVSSTEQLMQLLDLQPKDLPAQLAASREFPVRVPRPYLQKMRRGDPNDPLLLQVLPQGAELHQVPGFSADPLEERDANQQQGIIHKYQGRLLLIVSGSCAVNCRYCFRRHFPYTDNQLGGENWQQALDYIRADSSLSEVILSGGDPLATSDVRLRSLVDALSEIPHVQRLRLHTRLPVVLPARITTELLQTLKDTRLQTVLVTHCNHAQEIDEQFRQAMRQLREAGVHLLNQTVLLKGVNDRIEVLKQLSEALFAAGVLPYYLHVLDPVQGAAHFQLPDRQAQELVGELMRQLPGYLIPRLVREQAGEPAKVPLAPLLRG